MSEKQRANMTEEKKKRISEKVKETLRKKKEGYVNDNTNSKRSYENSF